LTFLAPGPHYQAQIYRDGTGADYSDGTDDLTIEKRTVTSKDLLDVAMTPAGRRAVRFRAL
jgi:alpha-glucosidase